MGLWRYRLTMSGFMVVSSLPDQKSSSKPVRIPPPWYRSKSGSVAESVGKRGRGKSHCVEKSKGGTFPLRLEIPQERRDFHYWNGPPLVPRTDYLVC